MNFWDTLCKNIKELKVISTGAVQSLVLKVKPIDGSKDSEKLFYQLLGLLGGGLTLAGIIIFNTIQKGSNSQILGINRVAPIAGGAFIGLYGNCLQANESPPDEGEIYEPRFNDSSDLPTDEIFRFITLYDKKAPKILSRYSFLDHLNISSFTECLKQMGVWVLTDDIGFTRVKRELFPEEMFFCYGPIEVLFWLREILKDIVVDISKLKFDKQLIIAFNLNHRLGFINEELFKDCQEQFRFTIGNN